MVLIWEMSFWTQLAPSRRSVCVKYIISFFFWIKKKKVFPLCLVPGGHLYLRSYFRDLQSSLARVLHVEGCPAVGSCWGFNSIHSSWINSGLFCLYFTHFSPVPPYPFSSITPSCLDSRSSPPLAWGFLWNVWNDSREIFQIINKLSVRSTAMHLKLFFSMTIKMLLYA